MGELRSGSSAGGQLIWSAGNLKVRPTQDSLFYKEYELISSKGNQTVNGTLTFNSSITTTKTTYKSVIIGTEKDAMIGVYNNTMNFYTGTDGSATNGWLFRRTTNGSGVTNAFSIDGSGNTTASGYVLTGAAQSNLVNALTRKDYVDTQDALKLDKAGGTITGDLSVTGNTTLAKTPIIEGMTLAAFEEAPMPDVWIPFTDSLQMWNGYGDDVYVGKIKVYTQATFSRASTATYIDKSGVLRTAGINEPRFEKEGLLIEGSSTNLLQNSKFQQVAITSAPATGVWSSSLTTASLTQNNDPGAFNDNTGALLSVLRDAGGYNYVTCRTGAANDGTYTISLYVKAGNQSSFSVVLSGDASATNGIRAAFNIDTETVSVLQNMGTGTGASVKFGKTVNGYKRVSATVTLTGVTNVSVFLYAGVYHSNSNFETVYVSDVQVEALPFATSYIPTSGAAATRAADVCSIPMDNNQQLVGQDLTFSVNLDINKAYRSDGVQVSSNWRQSIFWSDNNGTSLGNQLAFSPRDQDGFYGFIARWGNDGYCLNQVAASTNMYSNYLSGIVSMRKTAGVRNDICWILNGNQFMGGVNVESNISSQIPGSNIRIGSGVVTSRNSIWGHIRNLRIWHRALSDAALKSLR